MIDTLTTAATTHARSPQSDDLLDVPLDELAARHGARIRALTRRALGEDEASARPQVSRFNSSI